MGLTDTLAARGHAALSAIQPQSHLMHPFGADRERKWREAGSPGLAAMGLTGPGGHGANGAWRPGANGPGGHGANAAQQKSTVPALPAGTVLDWRDHALGVTGKLRLPMPHYGPSTSS